ncbi:carbohydrate sulfotransferase 7 isoform X2 [Ascaphus truei]|uniref:carbohydrate sulfotransferase 7 isoform X2 n=1 Tax=Ascaphus truei TaxID=8439 RepID=UPI003F5ADB14
MKKRRARKLWLVLLLYSALLLLLLSLLLQEGSWWRGRSRGTEDSAGGWEKPPRRCPRLDPAQWQEAEEAEEEEADPDPPASPRTHIYLHATWRSGSSFLGELFNQHPRVFYLYEPAWHVWQSLYPGDARSLQGALRDLLRSLFQCDFSALRLYAGANLSTAGLFGWRSSKVLCSAPLCAPGGRRDRVGLVEQGECERRCPGRPLRELERECRRYPVMVIKDVRLLEVAALQPLLRDPALNLRVVQLFRDPRAVHNSRLRSGRSLLRESVQLLRGRLQRDGVHGLLHRGGGADYLLSGALEVICQAWLRDLLLLRPPAPDWLRRRYLKLRYEDLVLRPREELGRLLRFAGLPALPELEDFLLNMTRGPAGSSGSGNRAFEVSARDAREVVGAWRERLSREQVRRVEEACGEAMAVLSYLPEEGEERRP